MKTHPGPSASFYPPSPTRSAHATGAAPVLPSGGRGPAIAPRLRVAHLHVRSVVHRWLLRFISIKSIVITMESSTYRGISNIYRVSSQYRSCSNFIYRQNPNFGR